MSPKKKGLPPLAWVGIGCGGMLAIAIIGGAFLFGWGKRKFNEFQTDFAAQMAFTPERSAAEAIIDINPDIELVTDDSAMGEMTVLIRSTGEEITLSYQDLAEGNYTIENPDGTRTQVGSSDLSNLPAWIPAYPTMEDARIPFHQQSADTITGLLTFSTDDDPEQVEEFYDLEIDFPSTSASSTTFGNHENISLSYKKGEMDLSILILRADPSGKTRVQVAYETPVP